MFFACHFQEEHSSLDNKNYVESIFLLYRIKYQKIKIDLTSPLRLNALILENSVYVSESGINSIYMKCNLKNFLNT